MLSKTELQAISKIIYEVDFYKILKVASHASEEEIRSAFHREALSLHPDQYKAEKDPEIQELVKMIYSRVVAAYRTLSHTERRADYDRDLKSKNQSGGSRPSSSPGEGPDENEITSIRRVEKTSTTSAGLRFFKLAQAAYQKKDLNSAKMNIQIALNTDSKNPEYLDLLSRVESEILKKKK